MRLQLPLVPLFFSAVLFSACGAPTETAGDEASLFSVDAVSLDAKVQKVCSSLAKRSAAPTTSGFTLNLDGCKGAASDASDYKKISSFHYADLAATSQTATTADSVHKAVRAQLWLNRSFLSLANAITQMMSKNKASGVGAIHLPDSATKAIANIVTPVLTMTTAPKLDVANVEFSMALNMTLSGVIKVNQDLNITGKLLDDAFAVTVKSTGEQTYDKSLIKSMEAVLVIMPYANDVYLDIFIDLTMFTTGVQAIINTQLDTFLSTSLKGVMDSVMAL